MNEEVTYELEYTEKFYSDIEKLRTTPNLIKKIDTFLDEIEQHPSWGIGKPEALKGNLSGLYSVRIDGKNRLVFRISNGAIEIAQCKTHYGDK